MTGRNGISPRCIRDAGWKKCDRGWISRLESGDVILRDNDFPYLYAVLGDEFLKAFVVLIPKQVTPHKSDPLLAGRACIAILVSHCGIFLH